MKLVKSALLAFIFIWGIPGCSLFFGYPETTPPQDADAEPDGSDLAETEAEPDRADANDPGVEETSPDAEADQADAVEDPQGDVETEPVCGNSIPEAGEDCDDGADGDDRDGCRDDCSFTCIVVTQATDCDDSDVCTNDTCNASSHTCQYSIAEGARCDDGNGCTALDTCDAAGICAGTTLTPCDWMIRLDLSLSADPATVPTAVAETSDGSYVVAGYKNGGPLGNADAWLSRISPSGAVEWQMAIGGGQNDYANDVIVTSDGGLVVAGTTNSWDAAFPLDLHQMNGWILKLNGSRLIVWEKMLGGMDDDAVVSAVETSAGEIAFTGYSDSGANRQVWAGLLDSSGNLQWHERIGWDYGDEGRSIIETSDHDLVLAARGEDDYDFSSDGWVIKLARTDGSMIWKKKYRRESVIVSLNDIAVNPATGGILLGGYLGNSYPVYWFGEMASDGSGTVWQNQIGTASDTRKFIYNLAPTSDGGLLLSGVLPHGGQDIFLVKLGARDGSGSIVWQKLVGPAATLYNPVHSLIVTSETHIVMAGWMQQAASDWDLLLIKMPPDANSPGCSGLIGDGFGTLGAAGESPGELTNATFTMVTNGAAGTTAGIVDTSYGSSFLCP